MSGSSRSGGQLQRLFKDVVGDAAALTQVFNNSFNLLNAPWVRGINVCGLGNKLSIERSGLIDIGFSGLEL